MKQTNIFFRLVPAILLMLAVLNGKTDTISDNVTDVSANNGMQIGLVGEFNSWGFDVYPDHWMTQSISDPDLWTTTIVLINDMDLYGEVDIIEMKFRVNEDWSINWGNSDFPSGIGFQDGPNIRVPIDLSAAEDIYYVTFNSSTGEYRFRKLHQLPISYFSAYLSILLIIGFLVFRFKK